MKEANSKSEAEPEGIERELFEAALRCYSVCHEDFDATVRMISSSRGLDPEYTKKVLKNVKERFSGTEYYKKRRTMIPKEFDV